ncbi:MAG: hypothetical protein ACO3E4_05150 [Candidatus Nanopelagicaceae bacterium]|jgi:hypothetical protein
MSKYSFLLQTKAEDYFELLPEIRMKKYGGWLVAEAIEQEEISKLQSQATIRAVQLAKKIALAKDIPLDEAFGLLQGGGGSITEAELLSEYTEETLSMITSGSSVESTNARMVTAFIRSRGQGMIDGEWQDLADWELEDTKNLPRKAIAKVVEFIAEEQNAETQEAMAAKKATKRNGPQ